MIIIIVADELRLCINSYSQQDNYKQFNKEKLLELVSLIILKKVNVKNYIKLKRTNRT